MSRTRATMLCAYCGEPITAYGQAVFHFETTMTQCDNEEGTRATKKEDA